MLSFGSLAFGASAFLSVTLSPPVARIRSLHRIEFRRTPRRAAHHRAESPSGTRVETGPAAHCCGGSHPTGDVSVPLWRPARPTGRDSRVRIPEYLPRPQRSV